MSWAEVKKVNSDMQEPLNYTNYIYDISVFGAESYVMDPNNNGIWAELSLNSCYLYGHTGIHDYVYNRLAEEDIDNLFAISARLGRQLNNFHSTDIYADGEINAVLAGMTIDSYNALEPKMRQGYQRYVNRKLSAASGVGAWIKEVFGLEFSSYETIADIINDPAAWDLLLTSEPVMVAVTSSAAAMEVITGSETAVEKLTQAIVYSYSNEVVIDTIINNEVLFAVIVDNEQAMNTIANNANSVKKIMESDVALLMCLNSEVATTVLTNNSIAVQQMADSYLDIQTQFVATMSVDDNFDNIRAILDKMIYGETINEKMVTAHTACETAVTAYQGIIDQVPVKTTTIDLFVNDDTYMQAILSSDRMIANLLQNVPVLIYLQAKLQNAKYVSWIKATLDKSSLFTNNGAITLGASESSFNQMQNYGLNTNTIIIPYQAYNVHPSMGCDYYMYYGANTSYVLYSSSISKNTTRNISNLISFRGAGFRFSAVTGNYYGFRIYKYTLK